MRGRLGVLRSMAVAPCIALAGALLSPAPVQAAETVTMWTFLNPDKDSPRDRALRQIIENFEAANPDIDIAVESQLWSTLTEKFVVSHRSGTAPDIGWVVGEAMGLLINSDTAADLAPLITDKWDAAYRDNLVLPQAYDWLTKDGKLHAMPIMAISLVLFYRQDLFAQAGIDIAKVTSWDAFADAAKKVQLEKDGRVERWGTGLHLSTEKTTMSPAANALMSLQGGRLFGENCKAMLANENGVRALEMQNALITEAKVASPESFVYTLDDVIEQFTAGKVAITTAGNSRYGSIAQKASWDPAGLAIMPWPSFDGKAPGPQLLSGWFAAVSKDSPHKAAAAKFVAYMTGPEAAELWTDPGGQVPIYKSVFEQEKFKAPAYDWMRDLAGMWAAAEVWLPPDCNATRTFADLNTASQKVVLGEQAPMDALKAAEQATAARQ